MQNNDGKHIHTVINTPCVTHNADSGTPCWSLPTKTEYLNAACGKRIRKAGFVGVISATALSIKAPGGRAATEKKHRRR